MNDEKERVEAELASINAQIAALSERKQKALRKLSAANSPLTQMSPEARREALTEVIAEGIVYLGERGQLPFPGQPEMPPVQGSRRKATTGSRKKKG